MTTGFPEIDAEHQELLRRFNQFHEAVKSHHGKEAVEKTLQLEKILGDWLRTHICTVDVQLRECAGSRS